MTMHSPAVIAGLVASAVGICFLPAVRRSADEGKELPSALSHLADAMEKKDATEVEKQARALARQFEVEDWMRLFALRRQKGLGVGEKPRAILPDGIEAKVLAMSKKPPTLKEMESQSEALARMGQVTAAIPRLT